MNDLAVLDIGLGLLLASLAWFTSTRTPYSAGVRYGLAMAAGIVLVVAGVMWLSA